MRSKDFSDVTMIYEVACLFCEVVWVSTMPHGRIFSCPKDGGGHKPLNSAAEELRVCPVIPSARDRVVWGLLVAEPAFAFAGTRSRSIGNNNQIVCGYGRIFWLIFCL